LTTINYCEALHFTIIAIEFWNHFVNQYFHFHQQSLMMCAKDNVALKQNKDYANFKILTRQHSFFHAGYFLKLQFKEPVKFFSFFFKEKSKFTATVKR